MREIPRDGMPEAARFSDFGALLVGTLFVSWLVVPQKKLPSSRARVGREKGGGGRVFESALVHVILWRHEDTWDSRGRKAGGERREKGG